MMKYKMTCPKHFLCAAMFCVLSVTLSADGASQRALLIEYARQFLGTPYKSGGTTRAGMDCSGF
ncbi:MAG: C40 family peptidase, partial [Spirochaetaceae bacterium]|nr:C40 family peptidase [Spirochaetaceae bacterium]